MGWRDDPVIGAPNGSKPSGVSTAKWKSDPVLRTVGGAKQTPGVSAALREIEKRYKYSPDSTMSERMTESTTLGGYGYGTRRLAQGRVALQRALPGGDKLPYTADEYYRAAQLYDAARREKYAAEHPGLAFASDILGAAVMPGEAAVGAFVTGSKAARLMAEGVRVPKAVQAAQAARLSGTAGAMSAVQAAAQARPGEAKREAVKQGTMGAVLAPVVGAALPAAIKVGQNAADVVSRVVNPRTAEQLAAEKLQQLLQKAQVTPALIRTALDDFSQTGSVSPTVYDVLRKAGASPDVLGLFRAKGSYPETRAAAKQYAEETSGNVQSRALEATRKLAPSPEALAAGVAPTAIAVPAGSKGLYGDVAETLSASENAYKSAFKNAQKANPESAVIDDEQRAPLRTALYQAVSPFLNPDLKSTSTVAKMFDNLTEGIVPPSQTRLPNLPADVEKYLASVNPADRPRFETNVRKSLKLDTPVKIAGEIPKNARPLTVAELFGKRRALGELADKFIASGDNEAAGAAGAAKKVLDAELTRLSSEGHIQGDPEVVNLWNQGLQGFAQHQQLKEAYGLGENLRTMPSDEFQQAVSNVPENLKAMVQAGGTQQMLNTLEKPAPGSTGLLEDLQGFRDTSNLATVYGDKGANLQRTLKGIEEQTQGAQELSQITGNQAPVDETFVSSPRDLLSARWLLADKALAKMRKGIDLSPEESVSLFNLMKSQGAPDLKALEGMSRVKTVGPRPRISAPIARAFAAPAGDKKSLDTLSDEYGLNY